MPILKKWEILSFSSVSIILQLYFENSLLVSLNPEEDEDTIQVEVVNPVFFKTIAYNRTLS